jgi:hypothetical protein
MTENWKVDTYRKQRVTKPSFFNFKRYKQYKNLQSNISPQLPYTNSTPFYSESFSDAASTLEFSIYGWFYWEN